MREGMEGEGAVRAEWAWRGREYVDDIWVKRSAMRGKQRRHKRSIGAERVERRETLRLKRAVKVFSIPVFSFTAT